MTSKTFCILPWIHIYANPDGNILPCCIGDWHEPLGNIRDGKLIDIWNNDKFKQLRLNMLNGVQSKECKSCYKAEESGKSKRQNDLEGFSKHLTRAKDTNPDGSLDTLDLKYFDLRWSNICNFKCRTCSSTYSSSWATEDNANGKDRKVFIFAGGESNDELYNQFLPEFKNIEKFYFAGGEPLLTDKHYDILNHLVDIGKTNVHIEYNSNLSSLKYKNILITDLWKKFEKVDIFASLDSWGPRAEYIRDGTKWQTIEDNIRLIRKEAPHVYIGISVTVSIFNVYTLTDFLDYIIDTKLFPASITPYFYNIMTPIHYGYHVIDPQLKKRIIDKINGKMKTYNPSIQYELKKVVASLENSHFSVKIKSEFLDNVDHYDRIRDQKFLETFPELANCYNNKYDYE